jgi:hypothetical protein
MKAWQPGKAGGNGKYFEKNVALFHELGHISGKLAVT